MDSSEGEGRPGRWGVMPAARSRYRASAHPQSVPQNWERVGGESAFSKSAVVSKPALSAVLHPPSHRSPHLARLIPRPISRPQALLWVSIASSPDSCCPRKLSHTLFNVRAIGVGKGRLPERERRRHLD